MSTSKLLIVISWLWLLVVRAARYDRCQIPTGPNTWIDQQWLALKQQGGYDYVLFNEVQRIKQINDPEIVSLDAFLRYHVAPLCHPTIEQYYFHEEARANYPPDTQAPFAGGTGLTGNSFQEAHAKYIISYNPTTGLGYVIGHSLNLKLKQGDSSDIPDEILTDRMDTYSQHAYCWNFATADLATIITIFGITRPALRGYNRDHTCDGLNQNILHSLTTTYTVAYTETCSTAWHTAASAVIGFTMEKIRNAIMVPTPNPECIRTSLLGGRTIYYFVQRSKTAPVSLGCLGKLASTSQHPWDRFYNPQICRESSKADGTLSPYLCSVIHYGVDPWLQVAKARNQHLIVSNQRQSSGGFPSVYVNSGASNYGVYYLESWNAQLTIGSARHEKIGFSADAAGNTVCIGDSNSVLPQINHPGMIICFDNANWANTLRGMVSTIDMTNADVYSTYPLDDPLDQYMTRRQAIGRRVRLIVPTTIDLRDYSTGQASTRSYFYRRQNHPPISKIARSHPCFGGDSEDEEEDSSDDSDGFVTSGGKRKLTGDHDKRKKAK